ncbi:MAG TPA: M4 family metallopeptidase [Kofleriaceae bacterium]|nr:M4 family metallopeptidase [Kofleriaceae bacterium]
MTIRTDPKHWIRGALLAAAVAGCQSPEPKDDPAGDRDIEAALAALPEARVLMASADGVPQYIVGELGTIDPAHEVGLGAAGDDRALRSALPPILEALRLSSEALVLRKVTTDESGARHFRYDQKRDGLEVVGGDLVVHVDARGAIFGINGTARGDLAPAAATSRPSDAIEVSERAASLAVEGDARWASLDGRVITGSRLVYLQTPEGALHKAHEQIVEGSRGTARGLDPVRDKVFVDAQSGEILAVHPLIHHARYRKVYVGATLVRVEGQAPTGDLDVDAAYDNLGTVYNAYNHFWNRDSYDNAGAPLVATVHYSTNYCAAFWNGSQMFYGDGSPSQNCGPLARSLDVTAHELTHAVIQHESNLTFSGESGGLNESISDIFGAFIEAFGDGGSNGTLAINAQTFLVGDEVMPPFIRNLCDPAADGVSRDIWTSDIGSVDVHYSSGPNNLVFCLLTKGGTHPRGKTAINVPAIGMEKAGRIFYKANTDLLTASSNYNAIRTAAIQAAIQLGYDQATQDAVACAYAAIAVGTAPASCGGTPPPDGVLTNGVPVPGISDPVAGNFRFWSLSVPTGQSTLTFTVSGGTGDVDLYVNYGSKPTTTAFQCRPYLAGNSETCTFAPPTAGTYWVGLRGYSAYSGVTLTGTYNANDPYLQNNVAVNNLSGASGSAQYYRIAVPAGKTLTIKTSGGTGDVDLYTRSGTRPTTAIYACRPYVSGNTETCTHAATATAGDWYVMLRGFAAYSGVTLIGSY